MARPVAAGLMLSLWLMLGLLAASPRLHHLLHQDSHATTHTCLISQVSQGTFTCGLSSAPAPSPVAIVFGALSQGETIFLSVSDHSLAPSRGPPSFPSNLVLV